MKDLLGFVVGLVVGLVVMDRLDSAITNKALLEDQREEFEALLAKRRNDAEA
jgi:uncharacterized membrane-anchored protein YhcB (DUF1043 family)